MSVDQSTNSVEHRNVKDFPGYSVDVDGVPWSGDKQLKPQRAGKGYRKVSFCRDGKVFQRYVHRLVLEAFVGPCPDGMECLHENGIRSDNRLSNIAWGTPTQNQMDRVRHGTDGRGDKCPTSRLKEHQVRLLISMASAGVTQPVLAKIFEVSRGHVSMLVTRRRWAHLV